MKKKRTSQVKKYLKGKISSSSCECCSRDCLVTVDGVCLRCMRAIIFFLKRQFASGTGDNGDRGIIAGQRPASFSKAEIADMQRGAIPVKRKKKSRVLVDEDLEEEPRRRTLQSGFEWQDAG